MINVRNRLADLERRADVAADPAEPEWARARNAAKRAAFDPDVLWAEIELVLAEVLEAQHRKLVDD